jgi:hypothetical protein
MRDKTILALALLLALALPGLATAAGDPLRLSAPAAGSEPDPLALCAAAPATAAPQGLPPNLATELGVGGDALICGSCSSNACLDASAGDYCGAYPKDGFCNMTATVCTDGRNRCYCKLSYP